MPRKRAFLDVRDHLEYVQVFVELLQRYGWCPLAIEEAKKLSLCNRAIMRKADEKRKSGNRKDIYVPAPQTKAEEYDSIRAAIISYRD